MIKKILCVSVIFLTSTNYSYAMKSADFSTMSSCLAGVKSASGKQLEILRDNPDKVQGYLAGTTKSWACVKEESGTKGTYYNGWFDDE